MSEQIIVKATINNMPKELHYPYLIVRHVEDELWYYGNDPDYQKASDIALEIRNGFVLEVVKGEIE